jgi:tRNA-dihydrouridine synthase B
MGQIKAHSTQARTLMKIGPHTISPALGLAPMAGVTDKPFRLLCKTLGAGLATSEMTTPIRPVAHAQVARRMDHAGEPGTDQRPDRRHRAEIMAEAARHNVAHGADIIDINMGCPAKKVCKAWAGSALMRDEALVAESWMPWSRPSMYR